MNRNVYTGWKNIRRDVTASDTALNAATYDSLPTNRVNISANATNLKLIAFGTGTEDGTADIILFGGHGQKGREYQPAIYLGKITFTLGTMQANKDPVDVALPALVNNYYFDSAASIPPVRGGVADPRGGNDMPNNRIGMMVIRLTGESWIYAEIGTLTNITNFNLVGSWVNENLPET